ncbi:hypothetical protein WMY93_012084 [Mugilogobius chulae]|uniref:Protein kinase domain-containing protein n=1 Tax=Mugilogobius chulae TaxID=88201 RepID=A0AAW0PAJ2_9GOBI
MSDILGLKLREYRTLEVLGEGAFGEVLHCFKPQTSESVAIKVIKGSDPNAFREEVKMLHHVKELDADKYNIIKFLDYFDWNRQRCLVFEMLDISLKDMLARRNTLTLAEIRPIAQQLLVAFDGLRQIGVVHTDLKLDNVMLVNQKDQPLRVKLIDFGVAYLKSELWVGIDVQPTAYQAPEISLGLPPTEALDMWSLGCVLVNLHLGAHPFSGTPFENQTSIINALGFPPNELLNQGKFSKKYYVKEEDGRWRLKTDEEIKIQIGLPPLNDPGPLQGCTLDEAILSYPEITHETEFKDRMNFLRLVKRLLDLDFSKRITPGEALHHPFITMEYMKEDESDYAEWAQEIMTMVLNNNSCDSQEQTPIETSEEEEWDSPIELQDEMVVNDFNGQPPISVHEEHREEVQPRETFPFERDNKTQENYTQTTNELTHLNKDKPLNIIPAVTDAEEESLNVNSQASIRKSVKNFLSWRGFLFSSMLIVQAVLCYMLTESLMLLAAVSLPMILWGCLAFSFRKSYSTHEFKTNNHQRELITEQTLANNSSGQQAEPKEESDNYERDKQSQGNVSQTIHNSEEPTISSNPEYLVIDVDEKSGEPSMCCSNRNSPSTISRNPENVVINMDEDSSDLGSESSMCNSLRNCLNANDDNFQEEIVSREQTFANNSIRQPPNQNSNMSDILGLKLREYRTLEVLGEGAFGEVLHCFKPQTSESVAIKVIKGSDPNAFREELKKTCLARRNTLTLAEIRPIAQQLLVAFDGLRQIGVVHTDLKLDNVMLVNQKDQPLRVKLIDFGVAYLKSELWVGIDVQPTAYQAPEISLGLPPTEALDMWSLGCVLVNLHLGAHPFSGTPFENQTSIINALGFPPNELLNQGKFSKKYYVKEEDGPLQGCTLDEAILSYPEITHETEFKDRISFLRLVKRLLDLDFSKRITPGEALHHPFITMEYMKEDESDYAEWAQEIMTMVLNNNSSDSQEQTPIETSEEEEWDSPIELQEYLVIDVDEESLEISGEPSMCCSNRNGSSTEHVIINMDEDSPDLGIDPNMCNSFRNCLVANDDNLQEEMVSIEQTFVNVSNGQPPDTKERRDNYDSFSQGNSSQTNNPQELPISRNPEYVVIDMDEDW